LSQWALAVSGQFETLITCDKSILTVVHHILSKTARVGVTAEFPHLVLIVTLNKYFGFGSIEII